MRHALLAAAVLAFSAPSRAVELPPAIASFDMSALDRSVPPCADFYQFACGNWMKTHPIPSDQARWGRFQELIERNRLVLRGILEAAASGPKSDPIDRRLGDLYGACMDEAAVEKRGLEPLKDDLAAIDAMRSTTDMPAVLARLHEEGVNAAFEFSSDQDFKDSSKVIGEIAQSGLGLPDRDYYLKMDEKSATLRRQYLWHVTKMFGLLGDEPKKAAENADAVLRLETELASASLSRTTLRDPQQTYHRLDAAQLAKLAPGFDWNLYLAKTGAPASPWFNAVSTGFPAGFSSMLASKPLADWKTYLRWRVVRSAAAWLPREFVEESFDFGGRKLQGAKELKPRWKRCVELADGALGEDLGRRFVDLTFGTEGKKRTDELITSIQKSLRQDLTALPWMTDKTRRRALEKFDAITDKVGYPKKWRDYSSVQIDRGDLLGSVRRARAFETKRRLSKIGKPVDRVEWLLTPQTVNAYYNAQINEIVFPAGILQSPFFDRTGDQAVNLGAIGVVIGHELTHGFDDEGRQFDAKGNMADWWTPEDTKKFEEKTSCLVDQYAGYESVPGVKLNGKLTLGENTADNGGVVLAEMALDDLKKATKVPDSLNGFTPEQRLYLGFAQVWCQNATEETLRMLATVDPHSPGRFRVLGPLSNSEGFRKAFSCKPGDAMVSAKSCRVW